MAVTEKRWKVPELVAWTAGYLGEKGFHNPRLNAELLLSAALGLKRLDLYLQHDRPLDAGELAGFKARLLRRAKREPLQYIEGRAAFRHLLLGVDPRVLIPRPETELLVQAVLDWAAGREGLSVLDVGTGSGAVALALATEGRFARVVATDVSAGALEVAARNRDAAGAEVRVDFRLGSLYAPVRGERFDVVVSNPPYVGDEERDGLDAEVREWEPGEALFAGSGGLDVIAPLVAGAPEQLEPGGLLALEIGAAQGAAVAGMVRETGCFAEPAVRRDLAGRDRMVLAELKPQDGVE
ncbi:MAG TPA: peptide chain release factor N(5)-glutamine methyltransferase [Longimicrobiaceae bacterium]|nr:peptide chain release factor N(5)-glutamine methyltransferase [Longimicrobiaceae bacterium]